jgi:hypothetical protein
MALLLVILGLLIMFLVNWTLGIILLIIGIVLLFVPAIPYGYNSWRGPPR